MIKEEIILFGECYDLLKYLSASIQIKQMLNRCRWLIMVLDIVCRCCFILLDGIFFVLLLPILMFVDTIRWSIDTLLGDSADLHGLSDNCVISYLHILIASSIIPLFPYLSSHLLSALFCMHDSVCILSSKINKFRSPHRTT